MYEVYEHDDLILPILKLPSPCAIRVELHDDKVVLNVGPRDWVWDRKTGELRGAGTEFTKPVADDSDHHSI